MQILALDEWQKSHVNRENQKEVKILPLQEWQIWCTSVVHASMSNLTHQAWQTHVSAAAAASRGAMVDVCQVKNSWKSGRLQSTTQMNTVAICEQPKKCAQTLRKKCSCTPAGTHDW